MAGAEVVGLGEEAASIAAGACEVEEKHRACSVWRDGPAMLDATRMGDAMVAGGMLGGEAGVIDDDEEQDVEGRVGQPFPPSCQRRVGHRPWPG